MTLLIPPSNAPPLLDVHSKRLYVLVSAVAVVIVKGVSHWDKATPALAIGSGIIDKIRVSLCCGAQGSNGVTFNVSVTLVPAKSISEGVYVGFLISAGTIPRENLPVPEEVQLASVIGVILSSFIISVPAIWKVVLVLHMFASNVVITDSASKFNLKVSWITEKQGLSPMICKERVTKPLVISCSEGVYAPAIRFLSVPFQEPVPVELQVISE